MQLDHTFGHPQGSPTSNSQMRVGSVSNRDSRVQMALDTVKLAEALGPTQEHISFTDAHLK
jgi:hypothetical protein